MIRLVFVLLPFFISLIYLARVICALCLFHLYRLHEIWLFTFNICTFDAFTFIIFYTREHASITRNWSVMGERKNHVLNRERYVCMNECWVITCNLLTHTSFKQSTVLITANWTVFHAKYAYIYFAGAMFIRMFTRANYLCFLQRNFWMGENENTIYFKISKNHCFTAATAKFFVIKKSRTIHDKKVEIQGVCLKKMFAFIYSNTVKTIIIIIIFVKKDTQYFFRYLFLAVTSFCAGNLLNFKLTWKHKQMNQMAIQ